jgi:hypothetical protein
MCAGCNTHTASVNPWFYVGKLEGEKDGERKGGTRDEEDEEANVHLETDKKQKRS